jgi:hypothetical protein
MGAGGIYYVPCAQTDEIAREVPVRASIRRPKRIASSPRREDVGLPATGRRVSFLLVSPNGRTLLYSLLANREADSMLLEDFR